MLLTGAPWSDHICPVWVQMCKQQDTDGVTEVEVEPLWVWVCELQSVFGDGHISALGWVSQHPLSRREAASTHEAMCMHSLTYSRQHTQTHTHTPTRTCCDHWSAFASSEKASALPLKMFL